jgi:hypothetical protein
MPKQYGIVVYGMEHLSRRGGNVLLMGYPTNNQNKIIEYLARVSGPPCKAPTRHNLKATFAVKRGRPVAELSDYHFKPIQGTMSRELAHTHALTSMLPLRCIYLVQ